LLPAQKRWLPGHEKAMHPKRNLLIQIYDLILLVVQHQVTCSFRYWKFLPGGIYQQLLSLGLFWLNPFLPVNTSSNFFYFNNITITQGVKNVKNVLTN